MIPALNWREIGRVAELAAQALVGSHLDRILIAERPEFIEGYLKNEWCLRFGDRKREAVLCFSVRPRACYFTVASGKGPKPSPKATRSPFDQALSKHIKGHKLIALRSIARERYVVLEFDGGFQLILALIPALPEAFLVESATGAILARSRTIRDESKQLTHWEELVGSLELWSRNIESALRAEALQRRSERALREIREQSKALRARLRQGDEELQRAKREPEWGALGEKLKEWIHALPEPVAGFWQLEGTSVPCGEGLSPAEQMNKLFSLERRRKRRIEEASSRTTLARDRLSELERWSDAVLDPERDLADLEKAAGLGPSSRPSEARKGPKWSGRTYFSKDGIALLVGRSREENLELTFKIAKGNDLWMHVRGRPGAHLVIPLPSGKSASLETLLDAAQLVIFHSGGRNWGKTEVDYTFKKYVKRIRDSSEASYVQNKTLIVAPDPERLKRLLGESPKSV
jgi:predicted ribosome quality control (RQC) complex YloA/Tae2 family protein